ncbi:DUF3892 domain-containing protein [Flavobacterium sp. LS1P28]|uniref:DUF3892 domain-containing protein n=1 Tax=Flavobacterium sp. LS1P28 TaxID=2497752 RepID=UPI000F825CB1|nr:DUF3892 domain-containing protein [Flavobacterium sp. LS1P28]RTY78581.1 DUF3892 domain-containing protein [Flavobacterium sp. LS1P28]|tara:strand:- start:39 stop:365 length:327 start_codon:yes stop_codon:yes gene_type:complete
MSEYRISGIWKNSQEVITHYAVHIRTRNQAGNGYEIGRAAKMTKADAVVLLQNPANSAKTFLWNYARTQWVAGEEVHVVNGNPSFLRTNHDGTLKDNLLHLINYGYVY